ncbi:MAG: PEP-CTERM sorting domain-containing protein [Pirellulales bacterium]|nr:PEP-CTERM sorting domain-containing protein [Pirellulales bacterium]
MFGRLQGLAYCGIVLCIAAMAASPAFAELFDRGIQVGTGGVEYHLIYDDTLNLTWVDYTFGYTGFGHTSYNQSQYGKAKDWADTLAIAVGDQVFDDWRLPQVIPVYDLNYKYDGSTDYGYNITRTGSELSHLYHVTLGNLSKYATDGTPRSPGTYGLLNTGLFQNLVGTPGGFGYWSQSIYPDGTGNQFGSLFSEGLQCRLSNQSGNQEWGIAVRIGDVPEPSTLTLLGLGMLAVAVLRLRRR